MPFIYSTLTCSNSFPIYMPTDPKSPAISLREIEIKGGHGLAHPKGLDTPQGVVTQVSDEDLEYLKTDKTFMGFVDKGFLLIDNKKVNPAKRAADMAQRDRSSQMTEKDCKDAGAKLHKLED